MPDHTPLDEIDRRLKVLLARAAFMVGRPYRSAEEFLLDVADSKERCHDAAKAAHAIATGVIDGIRLNKEDTAQVAGSLLTMRWAGECLVSTADAVLCELLKATVGDAHDPSCVCLACVEEEARRSGIRREADDLAGDSGIVAQADSESAEDLRQEIKALTSQRETLLGDRERLRLGRRALERTLREALQPMLPASEHRRLQGQEAAALLGELLEVIGRKEAQP